MFKNIHSLNIDLCLNLAFVELRVLDLKNDLTDNLGLILFYRQEYWNSFILNCNLNLMWFIVLKEN